MQYDLQNWVKCDIIIQNQKNTYRNSMKLLKPEESDQSKVIIFHGSFAWPKNRAPSSSRDKKRCHLLTTSPTTVKIEIDDNHDAHGADASYSPATRMTSGLARRHALETDPSLPAAIEEVLLRRL